MTIMPFCRMIHIIINYHEGGSITSRMLLPTACFEAPHCEPDLCDTRWWRRKTIPCCICSNVFIVFVHIYLLYFFCACSCLCYCPVLYLFYQKLCWWCILLQASVSRFVAGTCICIFRGICIFDRIIVKLWCILLGASGSRSAAGTCNCM